MALPFFGNGMKTDFFHSCGKRSGVGCHFLLQGIFLTQGWNPSLLHCRQILYQLSCKGSPIFPSGCEGKLGVALESLQGLRDLT